MDRQCPRCGISCPTGLNCPLCYAKLGNTTALRRPLMWALVAEVYLLVAVLVWIR